MENWVIFVVVGVVVGMNLGYMVGVRRGSQIVGDLLSGIMDSIIKLSGDANG